MAWPNWRNRKKRGRNHERTKDPYGDVVASLGWSERANAPSAGFRRRPLEKPSEVSTFEKEITPWSVFNWGVEVLLFLAAIPTIKLPQVQTPMEVKLPGDLSPVEEDDPPLIASLS
ncbi:hypothetical protein KM043_009617 [Ampulex compressa]|nr:hypothetical protein KM043_009617 [Ampulex compressa]